MLKKLPAIDYIVIFLRLFLKTLGIYVLLNLEISGPLILISVVVLALSELYEFPLMFVAQRSRRHRTVIFITLGFLNSIMVLGLITIVGQLEGDLYLFLVATVIGLSIGGGLTAGTVSSLVAATGYTILTMPGSLPLLTISIRAIFVLFIGTITGLLAEVVYHLNDEIEKVHEDKTQFRKMQIVKEKFITTASHHLRTPLTVIKGYAEMLNDPKTDDDDKEKARKNILKHTEELESLTEKLIHLASIQTIAEHLALRTQSLTPLLESIATKFVQQAQRKHIDFRYVVDASASNVKLEFDPNQLQIALVNLLSNAIKYTNKGGVVRLKVTANETHVFIVISDTGKGIPPEDISNLFSSFYHAGSPLDAQDGTGIGLFVTKEIIKAHNGDIAVQSQLGKGTTFTVKLPRNSISQLLNSL